LGFRGGDAKSVDCDTPVLPDCIASRKTQPFMPAIIVHGGAGWISDERAVVCIEGVERAAKAGYAVLMRGGSSMDAV